VKEPVELFTDCYLPAKAFPTLRRVVYASLVSLCSLRKALRLNRPRIFFTNDLAGCACYCAGSMDWPVIVLNVNSFRAPELYLRQAVESSLVHEMLHAYLETCGVDCYDYEHPEDEVENLARRYCDGLLAGEEVAEALDKMAEKELAED